MILLITFESKTGADPENNDRIIPNTVELSVP